MSDAPRTTNADCAYAAPCSRRPGYIQCSGIYRGQPIILSPNHCHACRFRRLPMFDRRETDPVDPTETPERTEP